MVSPTPHRWFIQANVFLFTLLVGVKGKRMLFAQSFVCLGLTNLGGLMVDI